MAKQLWTERAYGKFERNISLPAEVNFDNAKVEFKNGILYITLPKFEEFQTRIHKVPITLR